LRRTATRRSFERERNAQHYDAAIIGTGQGGKPFAIAMAAAGYGTAIIEREHVGGSCVNEGCTPTTTMVASARALIEEVFAILGETGNR
jgi:pyruvate/2-oxoglutarate dehydrogenase complex dihydrolipoamide dehydrogenase (E3) component